MTPKEKAKELVDKFTVVGLQIRQEGYQCAIIAVNEIILANPYSNTFKNVEYSSMDYWKEVKKEIEKL